MEKNKITMTTDQLVILRRNIENEKFNEIHNNNKANEIYKKIQ